MQNLSPKGPLFGQIVLSCVLQKNPKCRTLDIELKKKKQQQKTLFRWSKEKGSRHRWSDKVWSRHYDYIHTEGNEARVGTPGEQNTAELDLIMRHAVANKTRPEA